MNLKPKVCILTQTLLMGGAEKQVVLLAMTLSSEFDVTIIVYYGDKIDPLLKNKIDINGIHFNPLCGSNFSKLFELYKFLRRNKDIILFNYLLFPNFIGGIISMIIGIKKSIGGIRSANLKKNKFILERFIHNRLNNFTIFNNIEGLNYCVKNGFNKEKCIYIPNALFPIPSRIENRPYHEELRILSVGRFEDVKNYPFSLLIVKELIRRGIKLKYIIIGWGSKENEIRSLISKLEINDFVDVVIKPPNINEYYKTADLFLQTSKFEGLSNTLLEAMSFSLPIIATKVGDNEILVENNFGGYIIDERDISSFIEKIQILYEEPKKRQEFGFNSYNRILNSYSIDKFHQRYKHFILDILLK